MRTLTRSGAALAFAAAVAVRVVPAQDVPELLPENTLFYVGSNDVGQFFQTAREKPLGRILKEEEVQDFLEKPMNLLQGALGKALAAAKSHPALKDADLDPRVLLKGPFGRAFVALTHLTMAPGADEPDVGLVLGLEAKAGAVDLLSLVRQMLFSVAREGGEELTRQVVEVGAMSYEKAATPTGDGPPLCFAQVGGLSLLSLSEGTMREILEQAGGAQESLATSKPFQRCVALTGEATGGAPVVYLHVGQLMDMVDGLLSIAAMEAKGDDRQAIGIIQALLADLGFADVGPVYATSTWDGDVSVTRAYVETGTAPRGLFAALAGTETVDLGRLSLVPKSALGFSVAQIDLLPVYDAVMGALAASAPEMHETAMTAIRDFAAKVAGTDEAGNPAWDLREDLIAAVGGEFFGVSLPGPTTMFGPGGDWYGWLEARKPERLEQSIQYLARLPGAMGAPFPLTFKEQEHGGVKVKVLDMTSLGPAAMMAQAIQPTYAIHDGRLFMATSLRAMKKLLDSLQAPAPVPQEGVPPEDITGKEDFQRHWSRMQDLGEEVTSLSYSDTATNFENAYVAVSGMVPMLLMGPLAGQELPVDLELLPAAETMSQHLFGTVNAGYRVEGGIFSEARGPFGAELGLVLAAAIGGGVGLYAVVGEESEGPFVVIEDGDVEEEVTVVQLDPLQAARDTLQDLDTALTIYIVEHGEAPASLEELVTPRESFPKGYLQRDSLPVDPWGNDYHYRRLEGGKVMVWSSGPDGADAGGEGDDLKKVKVIQ